MSPPLDGTVPAPVKKGFPDGPLSRPREEPSFADWCRELDDRAQPPHTGPADCKHRISRASFQTKKQSGCAGVVACADPHCENATCSTARDTRWKGRVDRARERNTIKLRCHPIEPKPGDKRPRKGDVGGDEPKRTKRRIPADVWKSAEAFATKAPIRRGVERVELVSELYLELRQPRADVAAVEASFDWERRIEKAWNRAQKHVFSATRGRRGA